MSIPSPMITLALLVEHLRAPFPPTEIKFLPKSPVQRGDAWICLALPYADKRAYEDRLNALVPGRWSTPAMTPLDAGNKLVIPVTLVICEIAHTDVGEAFLTSLSRKGEPREEENAATEAYSQAFRRACAQVGLLPASPAAGLNGATASRPGPGQIQAGPSQGSEQPASAQEFAGAQAAPVLPHKDEERTAASAQGPQASAAASESNGNLYEASAVISPYQRSWIERQLGGDPSRIAKVCQFYQVGTLDELSGLQTGDLVNRLFTQQAEERQRRTPARGERPGQPKASKAVAR